MDTNLQRHQLELPEAMRAKLEQFRRRVWLVKIAEGLLAAVFGLAISYLLVFALDRVWDTPAVLRLAILIGGAAGLGILFPLKCHRWVWRQRHLEQVARLLKHRFPRLGDQLLGIVELAKSESEQQRSGALVRAAMAQVDKATRDRDFTDGVPHPRHRRWALAATLPVLLAAAALVLLPAAGRNALARWLMPWRDTERYTFAQLAELPEKIVIPVAEPFELTAPLVDGTEWRPEYGTARYEAQEPVHAQLQDNRYRFELPPQKEPGTLAVAIGDARESIQVEPKTRPELTALSARVTLPDYLQYSGPVEQDVRGGLASIVKGSQAKFEATATRELATATMDGQPQQVDGQRMITDPMPVEESLERQFTWQDNLGLSSKEPLVLKINAVDDEQPNIYCNKLQHDQVVLESEVLSFDVQADDDFGIKQIGLEWVGVSDPLRNPNPEKGEKIVSAGQPEARRLDALATFSAEREGVKPQTMQIRAYVEDYLPDRDRVYSPVYVVHVLSPDEHAIWLTDQLAKWSRAAQEVYEQERQLHETNKEIHRLAPEELDQPDTRRRIKKQAAAERANAARLGALTDIGEQLVQQATRNDQFGVGHLESLADMMQKLDEIAGQRMPSVAGLLTDAANAPGGQGQLAQADPNAGQPGQGEPSQGKPGQGKSGEAKPGEGKPGQGGGGESGDRTPEIDIPDGRETDPQDSDGQSKGGKSPPAVGTVRDSQSGGGGEQEPTDEDAGKTPDAAPQVVDVESSFNEPKKPDEDAPPAPPGQGGGKLGLPGSVVQGGGADFDTPPPGECPPAAPLDDAINEQADLLAEFAKIADELQKILGDLENSTFVKRLKAASRRQMEVAGDLNRTLNGAFGVDEEKIAEPQRERATKISEREVAQSESVYTIQEDLEAYYNRKQDGVLRSVLDEMQDMQVVGKLKDIGESVIDNLNGQSIVKAEFWADNLDRWAEELVGPGQPPGGT